MSTVLTIGVGAELVQRFAAACEGDVLSLGVEALDADGGLFARVVEAGSPGVTVLGPDVPEERALALATRADVLATPTCIVMATNSTDPDLWMRAMHAGVRDLLTADAHQDHVDGVVARGAEWAAARRDALRETSGDRGHRVIVVGSAKGGVGKTTVSTNLAVGLARSGHGSTVLVDLDVQFGDVASALGLAPEYTLPDTVHGAASTDPLVLKSFLTRHESGLYVVAGSDSPAAGDAVTAEQVARLIDTLSQEFRHVVVDTAPGLSDHTLVALERATDLVLMSSMDVPGVRGMRKELDVLTELNLVPRNRHLLLNGSDAAGGLNVADIEATLGAPLDVVLPRSNGVPLSTNTGVPLLSGSSKDQVSRGLQALVSRFLPEPETKRGVLGRLRVGAR
ncbi:AAA family ATPase [Klenkia sp. PcliD-1-E]|uniref:AAA family ATPase n=1 Tax=Klenkia sp. PcliD-1-E TaxID=2954492 RepID=UPI0027DF7AB3|nr:AAA family ATPase [Klenkia sp. PcliD-1-E]